MEGTQGSFEGQDGAAGIHAEIADRYCISRTSSCTAAFWAAVVAHALLHGRIFKTTEIQGVSMRCAHVPARMHASPVSKACALTWHTPHRLSDGLVSEPHPSKTGARGRRSTNIEVCYTPLPHTGECNLVRSTYGAALCLHFITALDVVYHDLSLSLPPSPRSSYKTASLRSRSACPLVEVNQVKTSCGLCAGETLSFGINHSIEKWKHVVLSP